MRLINTTTHKLEWHNDSSTPPYSILSHTWGNEEVTYEEWRAYLASRWPEPDNPFQLKPGPSWILRLKERAAFQKIVKFCEISQQRDINWAWVDTCCIDKSSSAELSEAINSMMRWYFHSVICYTYLVDVHDKDYESLRSPHTHYEGQESAMQCDMRKPDSFATSRWFTRGWTLQELLVPREIVFFDRDWHTIGTEYQLRLVIEHVTGISRRALRIRDVSRSWRTLTSQFAQLSVAERMSWASRRVTTRGEDTAYSLLGLFDINMPMLYGEGAVNSFRRLQEAIINRSTDHSIFAWSIHDDRDFGTYPGAATMPVLATSPAVFADCGKFPSPPNTKLFDVSSKKSYYSITNAGLMIDLALDMCPFCPLAGQSRSFEDVETVTCCLAILNCNVGICLRRDSRTGTFRRSHSDFLLPEINRKGHSRPSYQELCSFQILLDVQ